MKCSAQANKKSTGQMASRKQRALQGISGMVWRGRRELPLSEKAQSKEIKDGKSLLCHYLGEGGVCQAPEISTWLEGDCSAVGGRGGAEGTCLGYSGRCRRALQREISSS